MQLQTPILTVHLDFNKQSLHEIMKKDVWIDPVNKIISTSVLYHLFFSGLIE